VVNETVFEENVFMEESLKANSHSVLKFIAFYGTLKFITIFIRAHYWMLS